MKFQVIFEAGTQTKIFSIELDPCSRAGVVPSQKAVDRVSSIILVQTSGLEEKGCKYQLDFFVNLHNFRHLYLQGNHSGQRLLTTALPFLPKTALSDLGREWNNQNDVNKTYYLNITAARDCKVITKLRSTVAKVPIRLNGTVYLKLSAI